MREVYNYNHDSGRELTHKQWCIVKWVAAGMKNKDIAPLVGTTEMTIKTYIRVIFDKTGMSNRVELALWYVSRNERTHYENTSIVTAEHHRAADFDRAGPSPT